MRVVFLIANVVFYSLVDFSNVARMSVELSRIGLMLNPRPFFRSSSSSSFNWCDDRL